MGGVLENNKSTAEFSRTHFLAPEHRKTSERRKIRRYFRSGFFFPDAENVILWLRTLHYGLKQENASSTDVQMQNATKCLHFSWLIISTLCGPWDSVTKKRRRRGNKLAARETLRKGEKKNVGRKCHFHLSRLKPLWDLVKKGVGFRNKSFFSEGQGTRL